jgi:hypothetical protein
VCNHCPFVVMLNGKCGSVLEGRGHKQWVQGRDNHQMAHSSTGHTCLERAALVLGNCLQTLPPFGGMLYGVQPDFGHCCCWHHCCQPHHHHSCLLTAPFASAAAAVTAAFDAAASPAACPAAGAAAAAATTLLPLLLLQRRLPSWRKSIRPRGLQWWPSAATARRHTHRYDHVHGLCMAYTGVHVMFMFMCKPHSWLAHARKTITDGRIAVSGKISWKNRAAL